jgi:dTDP-glucose 4,6-dehydratase
MLCTIVDAQLTSKPELRARYPDSAAAHGGSSEHLVRFVKDRLGHDRRYAIDDAKIERECGFRPQIALGAGLRATVAWYLERATTVRIEWQRTIAN